MQDTALHIFSFVPKHEVLKNLNWLFIWLNLLFWKGSQFCFCNTKIDEAICRLTSLNRFLTKVNEGGFYLYV